MTVTVTFDPTDSKSLGDAVSILAMFGAYARPPGDGELAVITETAPDPTPAATPEPVTATTEAAAGVELDTNGTPWIEGIHATTKSKKADGTWTKKRGTDDTVLRDAEAAARAEIAGTPAAPDLPPVEVETSTVPPVEMPELVAKYSEKHTAGLITSEAFVELYATYNTDPTDIATNETARRQIFDHLETLVPAETGLPQ